LELRSGSVKTREEIKRIDLSFHCEFCSMTYASNEPLIKHMKSCKSKTISVKLKDAMDEIIRLKAVNEMQERQLIDLKAQVADLINKQHSTALTAITKPPTNVKNTIKNLQINNLQPITNESLTQAIPSLTHDHIKAGAAGYAKYALEFPLRDKILVADAARRKLTWKDEDGQIVNDLEGTELSKKFFAVVKEPSLKAIRDLMRELQDRHGQAIVDDDDDEIRVCDTMMCKLDDLRREIRKTIGGEPTELRNDFVKEICVAPRAKDFDSNLFEPDTIKAK
jgi:hypothetical protein